MFLNFGIKHKYQAAVDAIIETLTDLRSLHIGQKATFLLNQREGLQGMCLKTPKGQLYNLSENLNYAFFWPQEAPESLELKNVGEKHYASYKMKDFSISNTSKDLVAVFYHKYRENLPTTPDTYTSEMNSKFLTRYAATASVPEASNAWKFDHWEQFTNTEWDKIEYCFKPVFKLDRVNEYWHMCPVIPDQTHSSVGYTENPNRNLNVSGYHNLHQSGYADQSTYVGPLYQGDPCYRVTYVYNGQTRQENFDMNALAKGTIPTVDYFQNTIRRDWKITYISYGHPWYGWVVHGCSHILSNGSVIFGEPYQVWEQIDYYDMYGRPIWNTHSKYREVYSQTAYSGKSAGIKLPNIAQEVEDPHAASARPVDFFDMAKSEATAEGHFSVSKEEEIVDIGIPLEEMVDILDYKEGEKVVYFEAEVSPGVWQTFYNNDVPHGMVLKLKNPDPIFKVRSYTKKFDIKGVIRKMMVTIEEDGYQFNAETWSKDVSDGKIMIIKHDFNNATLLSLSETGSFSYELDNGETIVSSAENGLLDNDIFNKASRIYDQEISSFGNDNSYKTYPYTDEIVDENADKKHHFIKISDTHYKIPNELILEYIPGKKKN